MRICNEPSLLVELILILVLVFVFVNFGFDIEKLIAAFAPFTPALSSMALRKLVCTPVIVYFRAP
jgi:hypothetical protein